jgi:hypothetical protein
MSLVYKMTPLVTCHVVRCTASVCVMCVWRAVQVSVGCHHHDISVSLCVLDCTILVIMKGVSDIVRE